MCVTVASRAPAISAFFVRVVLSALPNLDDQSLSGFFTNRRSSCSRVLAIACVAIVCSALVASGLIGRRDAPAGHGGEVRNLDVFVRRTPGGIEVWSAFLCVNGFTSDSMSDGDHGFHDTM